MKSSRQLGLSTLLLTLFSCTPYELGLVSEYEVVPPTSNEDPTTGPACYKVDFEQPEADHIKNIDLLFVVDTSGSLDLERAKIAQQIDAYVGKLPSDASIRIGVMMGHGPQSKWMGRLWANGSGDVVLDISKLGLASVRSKLTDRLTHTADDYYADGGEMNFYSLFKGIRGSLLTQSKAAGFFRDDAALAVVFVSDENEICHIYPKGTPRVADAEHYDGMELEKWAFREYCNVVPTGETAARNLSYKVMYSELKKLKGEQPLLVAAMVYTDPLHYPKSGENEYGYGYVEIVQESGGALVDLNSSDYTAGLALIGEMSATKMHLVTDFKLEHGKVDPLSIKVKIDDVDALYTYSSAANTVILTEPGAPHSKVNINYCLKEYSDPSDGCPITNPDCGGIGI